MNVAVFTDYRLMDPNSATGVGKHAYFMARGLAEDARFKVWSLAAKDQRNRRGLLDFLPQASLPLSYRTSRELWTWTGHPHADRWLGDADWLYCPDRDWVPLRRVKYAVTLHGAHEIDPDFAMERGLKLRAIGIRNRRQYRRLSERADLILTVSEWLKHFIIEQFGCDAQRICVVGNGVSPEFFAPSVDESTRSNDAAPYILCLGGLNFIDGGDRILALAECMKRAKSPWRIKVVGNQHEPSLLEQARRTGLIDLPGYIPHGRLAGLMRHAVAFYYPTRYETFGMGAAEALAAGVPIVTHRCTAVPEIVGECGLYVEPDVPQTALDAIFSLCDGSALRSSLIERGRKRALQFTWDSCVMRLKQALIS